MHAFIWTVSFLNAAAVAANTYLIWRDRVPHGHRRRHAFTTACYVAMLAWGLALVT